MTDQQDKLIHLTEKHKTPAVPELNARLTEIEKELRHLNAREAATNKAFLELAAESRKSVDGQNAKLDETQVKLVEMNNHYKKISQDYQRLAAGANLLSAKLEKAQEELTDKIDSVDVAAAKQAHDLGQAQLKLQERAERIEERATQLASDMESRIAIMQTTVETVEDRLRSEIREVEQKSEERDEQIIASLDRFQGEYYERAQEQEETQQAMEAELDAVNLRLTDSVNDLQQGTDDLAFQVNIVDTRTGELEEATESLDKTTKRQAALLSGLGESMQRHYKGFALALVLIAVTLAIVAYQTQMNKFDNLQIQSTVDEQTQQLKAEMLAQNQKQSGEIDSLKSTTAALTDALDGGDTKLGQSIAQQQTELASLRETVKQLEANNDNTASRLTAMLPNRQYGLDNTIHDAQWLQTQNADEYVVTVVSANNKQELYQVALRWSSLLDEAYLSAVETQVEGKSVYTLVYGPFADATQAQQIARFMPVADFYQRPAAVQIKDLGL